MKPYCRGRARIRAGRSGPIYTIESLELDWEVVDASPRQMGTESHYQAVVDHVELGSLTWNLWEYPEGMENYSETDVGGNELISDFDYGLAHEPDDADQQEQIDKVVNWFFQHYEDPAVRTPYESAEGGYQYIWGGPYDAREVIYEGFSDLPEWVVEAAVEQIERHGTEWAPIPREQDFEPVDDSQEDNEITVLPDQSPGISFVVREDGVIDLASTGVLTYGDENQISTISDVIAQTCEDLLITLHGSNAYGTIAEVARRYQHALTAQPRSLDTIFGLGVRLESAHARLQREVESGDYPEMAVAAGEALDSILRLHGSMILSTERGRLLVNNAEEYARTIEASDEFRAKSRAFANALHSSSGLVSDSARDLITEINQDVGDGAHPGRSSAVAGIANRNILITVAAAAIGGTFTGTMGNAFTASVPGTLLAGAVTGGSNAAWTFLVTNYDLLKGLVAVYGADLLWLNPVLEWTKTWVPKKIKK